MPTKLRTFKKQQLQEIAEAVGIPSEGLKTELADRLSQFLSENASRFPQYAQYVSPKKRAAAAARRESAPSTPNSSILSRMSNVVPSSLSKVISAKTDSEETSEESSEESSDEDEGDGEEGVLAKKTLELKEVAESAGHFGSEQISRLKRVPSQAYLKSKETATTVKESVAKKSDKLRDLLSTVYTVPLASVLLELLLIGKAYLKQLELLQSEEFQEFATSVTTPYALLTWASLLVFLPTIISYYMNFTTGAYRSTLDPLTFSLARALIIYMMQERLGSIALSLFCFKWTDSVCDTFYLGITPLLQAVQQVPLLSSAIEIIIVLVMAVRH